MVTFRNNNNRRSNFRRNTRTFKSNGDRNKFATSFSNNENFQRKIPSRNNQNASKLIEKYNNLAREALSSGDKILSENYFQHADHFTRVQVENENFKKNKFSSNPDNKIQDTTEQVTPTTNDEEKKDTFKEEENLDVNKTLSEAN